MKDAEFWAVGLGLGVEETGSHHRQLILHFHVKYRAKGTVPKHLSRARGQRISSRCYSGNLCMCSSCSIGTGVTKGRRQDPGEN